MMRWGWWKSARTASEPLLEAVAPARFESVVSVGTQCATSVFLQNAGLKTFSGPFDWIFSSLDMVSDCIEDDFETFLDRSHIARIPDEARPDPRANFADHRVYQQRYGLNSIFNHSDPTLPERYAYLQRCVARFRAMLTSPEPQLALAIGGVPAASDGAFARLATVLDQTPAMHGLMIFIGAPRTEPLLLPRENRGRHNSYTFHPVSALSGITFADTRDNRFLSEALSRMIALRHKATPV